MRKELGSNVVTHIGAALLAGALATVSAVSVVHAQKAGSDSNREAARAAYSAGRAAFDKGDYQAAYESFKLANETMPTPHALYWVAASLDKSGQIAPALEAYRALLADPEVDKIGADKVAYAKDRKAALETEVAAAAIAASSDPAAADAAAAAAAQKAEEESWPEVEQPAEQREGKDFAPPDEQEERGYWERLTPEDYLLELGAFTGPLFISREHDLVEDDLTAMRYVRPGWLFGGRVGFFPSKYAGLEGEFAGGIGKVKSTSADVRYITGRGMVVGQLPMWRLVPFVGVGVGGLRAKSSTTDGMGKDTDLLVTFGAGLKLAINQWFTLRADVREDLTERADGGMTGHEEALLGFGVTLGRTDDAK